MIKLELAGEYQMLLQNTGSQLLIIDERAQFAWLKGVKSDLLILTVGIQCGALLYLGKYRRYLIHNEPQFTDCVHLELLHPHEFWQGYLLPDGLPCAKQVQKSIHRTLEMITKSLFLPY